MAHAHQPPSRITVGSRDVVHQSSEPFNPPHRSEPCALSVLQPVRLGHTCIIALASMLSSQCPVQFTPQSLILHLLRHVRDCRLWDTPSVNHQCINHDVNGLRTPIFSVRCHCSWTSTEVGHQMLVLSAFAPAIVSTMTVCLQTPDYLESPWST